MKFHQITQIIAHTGAYFTLRNMPPFSCAFQNNGVHRFIPTRVSDIEAKVKGQYGIPPKTIENLPDNAMMNIKLL
ncbi:hypothetical protein [Gallibacterium anatis]|uniref:hypothetical protein n=1 Tax=Gallibacterium anatis TaxID=750 RepID=UPI0039FC74CC